MNRRMEQGDVKVSRDNTAADLQPSRRAEHLLHCGVPLVRDAVKQEVAAYVERFRSPAKVQKFCRPQQQNLLNFDATFRPSTVDAASHPFLAGCADESMHWTLPRSLPAFIRNDGNRIRNR